MNASNSFGRIVWKEYRAQRSVWLALLCGTVLLELPVCFRGTTWELPASYPFAVSLAMSVCFAATVVALLFAGEREDRTDEWLAQLPISSRRLVGAKLSAAVLSIASFALAALLTAGAAVWLTRLLLVRPPGGEIVGEGVEILPRAMIGTVLWGLLFSLATRSVLKSLLLTAAAELTTTGLATIGSNAVGDFDHRIYFGVLGCVLVADVWLARRWTSGPWNSLRVAERVRWRRRAGELREPRWLARAVRSGSPSLRIAGALIWREARSAVPFLLAWAALGLFCVDLQIRFLSPAIPTHVLFLLATPTACGMMTCLGDQQRGTFRFLTERGVSPWAVWLPKQAVWLSVAVVVVVLFGCWDALTPDRFEQTGRPVFSHTETMVETLHSVVTMPETQLPEAWSSIVSAGRVSAASFAWSLGLALFAVGQLASFWIRRTVLAASAAFVLWLGVIFWHVLAVAAGVPLLWTTWPLSLLLLAATWTTCGHWMREERTWRVRVIRAAWLIGTPLALVAAGRELRITQVPVVEFPFDWRAHAVEMDRSDPRLSRLAIAVSRSAREDSLRGDATDFPETPPPVVGDVRALSQALAEVTEPAQLAPEVLVDPAWNGGVIGREMARSCRELAAAGDLDAGWADVVAGLRVSEFRAQGVDWADWGNGLISHEILCGAARDWAADAQQTPERLRQALNDLERFSIDQWSPATMLMNRYVLYRQLLEQQGPLWERMERDGEILFDGLPFTELAYKRARWTGDRERLLRLMRLLTVRSLRRPNPEVYATASESSRPADPELPPDAEIVRWLATTWFGGGDFAADVATDVDGRSIVDQRYLEALALERGTMLAVALRIFQIEYNTFPVQLADLTPDVIAKLPRDPYTGGDFGYASNGFEAPVIPLGARVIPARQPLLWSAGLRRAVLAYHIEALEGPTETIPGNRYIASPLEWRSISPPTAPVSVEADPERIRVIILGTELPAWE